MASISVWEELIRPEWRLVRGERSSVDALDALEAELGVVVPAGWSSPAFVDI